VVVDASVWVGLLVPVDAHHAACRGWLRRHLANSASFVVPAHALAEIGGAIARRTGNALRGRLAVETVLATPGLQVVPIDAGLAQAGAELAADLQLRGADALYAVVASLLNLPLVTLDAELRQRASALVETVVP
jgi:predicted nucleic acid-binding protein